MAVRVAMKVAKVLNPLAAPIASTGLIGVWGVIHHTGRKSHKSYATPIALKPTRDGFIIPLPWGAGTDWCRNVLAEGRAVVTWHGKDHAVTAPEIVDRSVADPVYGPILRPALRLLGIKKFLKVTRS